jgi:hypothetical protein
MWGDLRPWGTHPHTDAWWSSSRLRVEAGEPALSRSARVRHVASDPLVQRHLRVCWENRAPTGNCSRCEKCVRTRIALAGVGALESCATFEPTADLPAAIDALPGFPPGYEHVWQDMLRLDLEGPTRAALERLILRSRPPARP